ncbi:MAG: PorT family protein [Prevotella sp.]|nr:PorT family protein [Prevotella sp.]
MKKLVLLAVVAMMATLSVNAQNTFVKPMVGPTFSKFTSFDDAKFKVGVVGGMEVGYYVSEPFALTAGLLVSLQGSNYKDEEYFKDQKTTMTYLNVPLLANYYVAPGFAIKAGIQPGFLLGRKSKGSEKVLLIQWEDYEITDTEGLKKLDLSIPIGLSYEFSNIVIDARYNLGLTKIIEDVKAKNSVFMLTLGYKISF